MAFKRLFIDCETYSEANLKKVGRYAYATHPSTEVIMMQYAFDDQPIAIWEPQYEPIPADLRAALRGGTGTSVEEIHAHNAMFEIDIIENVLGFKQDLRRWRCTMVHAFYLALPGSLEDLGKALGIENAKLAGTHLINWFCQPRKPTKKDPSTRRTKLTHPEKWEEFRRYGYVDVAALREVYHILNRWPMREEDLADWRMDQQINRRGLPLDVELLKSARNLYRKHRARCIAELEDLTGLDNPNSRDQMLTWLTREGCELSDLTAETVRDTLKRNDLSEDVRRTLELRQQIAVSSVSKYAALERSHVDGYVYGCFQFFGAARTGREAGRIFQPQNLARPKFKDLALAIDTVKSEDYELSQMLYGGVSQLLSTTIRPAIAAPKGKQLVVADYASIESVMLAWAAQSTYLLDLYRKGRDPYKDMAAKLFNVPYDKVTKAQRNYAKPIVLGCGYMLGPDGLVEYAAGYGVAMTFEQALEAVRVFRREYEDIPTFWWKVDAAMKRAVATGEVQHVNAFEIVVDKPFLRVRLPSGRFLSYRSPRIEMKRAPNGKLKSTLTYLDQDGRRISTHPGKIVENWVQAIARDVLFHGLRMATKDGFYVIGHVHDEVVSLEYETDDTALARLIQVITQLPSWCRSAPIRAAGYVSPFYKKD